MLIWLHQNKGELANQNAAYIIMHCIRIYNFLFDAAYQIWLRLAQ